MKDNIKICRNEKCENKFIQFNSLQTYCSFECSSKKVNKKKYIKINKVSKKQSIINAKYSVLRLEFLGKKENSICFIDGCNKKSDTVEHRRGRGAGYFDKWAEEMGVCKTLDTRYWAGCCLAHNLELENNPELSKKYQLSKIHGGKK